MKTTKKQLEFERLLKQVEVVQSIRELKDAQKTIELAITSKLITQKHNQELLNLLLKKSTTLKNHSSISGQIGKEERETLEKKLSAFDKLFAMFFIATSAISGLVLAFKATPVIFYFMASMFLVWIIYIYGYRAYFKFHNQAELSFIERVRGFSYLFSFIVTFSLNGISFFIGNAILSIAVMVIVPIFLGFVLVGACTKIFPEETKLFNDNQRNLFTETIANTCIFAIWFSFSVSIGGLLANSISDSFIVNIIGFIIAIAMFGVAYTKERISKLYLNSLTSSLEDTDWLGQYYKQQMKKIKEAEKRRRKSNNRG